MNLGIGLASQLSRLGYRVVEVYPFASRKGLCIGMDKGSPVDKRSREGRRRILVDLEREGIVIGSHRDRLLEDHDALDSAVCALTGLLWDLRDKRIENIGETKVFAVPRTPACDVGLSPSHSP